MAAENWEQHERQVLGWMLAREHDDEKQSVLTIFNASMQDQEFCLPEGWRWTCVLDTNSTDGKPTPGLAAQLVQQAKATLINRSMVVLLGEYDV